MELEKPILNSSDDKQSPAAKFWKRRTKREEPLHAILKYVRKNDDFAYKIKFVYQKRYHKQISKVTKRISAIYVSKKGLRSRICKKTSMHPHKQKT